MKPQSRRMAANSMGSKRAFIGTTTHLFADASVTHSIAEALNAVS